VLGSRRISLAWSVLRFLLRGRAGWMRPLEIVPWFARRVKIKCGQSRRWGKRREGRGRMSNNERARQKGLPERLWE